MKAENAESENIKDYQVHVHSFEEQKRSKLSFVLKNVEKMTLIDNIYECPEVMEISNNKAIAESYIINT